MVLASTGGDPSLDVMERHVRRILQPCGMEMKQDALAAKGDLLRAHHSMFRPDVNKASRGETLIGKAQAAPKKRRERGERKEQPLFCSFGKWSRPRPS